MMTSNTMRAAYPCIIWRIVSTWIPTWQTLHNVSQNLPNMAKHDLPMPRTKGQLHIRIRPTSPHLTPRGRLSSFPRDALATTIRRCNLHRTTRKPITKHIAHIIPNLVAIKTVRENGLANIWLEEPAFDGADFECDATGCWIGMEDLSIGSVFCNGVLLADTAADGPEVDGLVALVYYDCATEGLGAGGEGEGSECESMEKHCWQVEASDEVSGVIKTKT
jgi:hypothetical protein